MGLAQFTPPWQVKGPQVTQQQQSPFGHPSGGPAVGGICLAWEWESSRRCYREVQKYLLGSCNIKQALKFCRLSAESSSSFAPFLPFPLNFQIQEKVVGIAEQIPVSIVQTHPSLLLRTSCPALFLSSISHLRSCRFLAHLLHASCSCLAPFSFSKAKEEAEVRRRCVYLLL